MKHNNNSCDILVVGAGIAGITAALTASGCGCKTILLEKNEYIGGTIRKAFLNEICGLFYENINKQPELLNKGFSEKVFSLLANSDIKKVKKIGKVYVLPFSRNKLFNSLNNLLKKAPNLDTRLNNELLLLNTEKNRITYIEASNKLTLTKYKIFPEAIIDCSGSGIVLNKIGQKLAETIERQLAGFTIQLKGAREQKDKMLSIRVPYVLRKAVDESEFPLWVKYTTLNYSSKEKDELNIRLNIIPDKITCDELKNLSIKVHSYLSGNLEVLKNSVIKKLSPEICFREENRLKGKYIITESDVLSGREFYDCCMKGAWPVEHWSLYDGLKIKYTQNNGYYNIPIRCMQAAEIENLYAAGRCISATQKALAATRVIGTSIALGEQAALDAVRKIKNE